MTETRNRQLQFHSPFEEEIWVPRRDRIFVPSNFSGKKEKIQLVKNLYAHALEQMYRAEVTRWFDMDCAPGRNQFIVPTSEFAAGAWDHPPRNRPDFRDRVMDSRSRYLND